MKNDRIFRTLKQRSFRGILIASFVFVSIIPILTLQVFSYARLSDRLQENMNRLSEVNVAQIRNNLEISLEAYEDLLYQIYTSDEIVSLIYDIGEGVNPAVSMNQLRRVLRAMCYSKEGIESISIITGNGTAVYYDKLTASSVNSSWLDKDGLEKELVLELGLSDYNTKILPSEYALTLADSPRYLFHMVHRVIDYKKIDRNLGVVVLSLDEEILHKICNQNLSDSSLGFIVDNDGRIVSYPDKSKIGQSLPIYSPEAERGAYMNMLTKDGYVTEHTSVYISSSLGEWKIITAVNQQAFHENIQREQRAMLLMDAIILSVAVILIFAFTTLLSRSMNEVSNAMRQAHGGNLSAYVPETRVFSSEIAVIAKTFNEMMRRISELIEEIKSATNQKKDAEIKALEAQINPHFLYNVLDNINWMAIDNEQYEVSGMITSLAKILRYSINNSNITVTVKDELDWLKMYASLQQMRFKNSFEYTIEADEGLLGYPVHKLLLQPFVENSILHGFKNRENGKLKISVSAEENGVIFKVEDNGCGMDATLRTSADHIGMANAIGRIRAYYGDTAEVTVESSPGCGTAVNVLIRDTDGGAGL